MKRSRVSALASVAVVAALLGGALGAGTVAAKTPGSGPDASVSGAAAAGGRYIVVAKSAASYASMKATLVASGAKIVQELRATNAIVITGGAQASILSAQSVQSVARDKVQRIVPPESAGVKKPSAPRGAHLSWIGSPFIPDPAFQLPGLMWNVTRVNAPAAWQTTKGSPGVVVGVADTGLDFTHSELASKVTSVVDLTDPTLCLDYFGASDADLAAWYGGPANTDWNGHGSWIGGNIAGAADGVGLNGIAPGISLVALKIAEWCGYAWDSSILGAFQYAADNGINIVSISFGGYANRANPDEEVIYQQYVQTVAYARAHGTTIVASAGNEHARIGDGGRGLSHGTLTIPGDPLADYFGLYQTPGGIPGVVDVSSTGNVVEGASPSCPAGTADNYSATCKPISARHLPYGVGRNDQLAYYSNYGPRIDFAATGGARKFNLPGADGGGTPGWPVTTADGTKAYESFSITSNWAMEIPCYWAPGGGIPGNLNFYQGECYSTIQGTSMAAPVVSGVLALIASAQPSIAHNPDALVKTAKAAASFPFANYTPPLSATDKSAGDLTGIPCPTGYCHLGGDAIPGREAYGAGLVDARAVSRFVFIR
jgi:lantibiotic leader peptide-processing serine protease